MAKEKCQGDCSQMSSKMSHLTYKNHNEGPTSSTIIKLIFTNEIKKTNRTPLFKFSFSIPSEHMKA